MRLDHLLSTEFFEDAGLASVVWPTCREWFPEWCGRAGVEEIVGFAGSVGGRRAVVWVCFWVPGPPPATWSRAVFRMSPWGGRPAGVPCPDRCLGAWWFENWIVDASNAMIFSVIVCFIAISPGSVFWSLVSRSIVL